MVGPKVRAAGRIVLQRPGGKLIFADIRDMTGQIQLFIGQKQVGDGWQLAECFDLGDVIGVDGELRRTKTGELSIFVERLTMLAKSLAAPPEKHHGLTDPELRQRMRYLDLTYGEGVMPRFLNRTRIVRSIRETLHSRGFVEVEGPTLHSIAGGAAARPFKTHHNALDIDLFLRIALELHLKRLLVGGIERVYELGRVFRNEGISPKHNPEFTMLEAYQAYGDYRSMMDLTEACIVEAIRATGQPLVLPWGEATIDFTPPFARKTYDELFQEHAGVNPTDAAAIAKLAKSLGLETAGKHPDVIKSEVFEAKVEDALGGPDLRDRLPGEHLPAHQTEGRQPAGGRAVRVDHPRHGSRQRLHGVERPRLAGRVVQDAARRPAGRGLDGQDGPRFRAGAAARHAAGRRTRHRHRPARDAAHQLAVDPRRDSVPLVEAGVDSARRTGRLSDQSKTDNGRLPKDGFMYKLLLCWRYLRTRYIALVSIVSVMLGVATMIVVNAVMEGFTHEMQERIHGILSDIVFESRSLDGIPDADWHMQEIRRVAGDYIEGMSPTVHVPAMLSFKVGDQYVNKQITLIGVDEQRTPR